MDEFENSPIDIVDVPDIDDVTDDVDASFDDSVLEDLSEGIDSSCEGVDSSDIDLDNMSLDDLYALRDEITDAGSISGDSDCNFVWDGSPTHDISLDEETEPDYPVKTLKR